MKRFFLTGATGLIGKRLVRELHPNAEIIYIAVRPRSMENAKKEFQGFEKVVYVASDLTDERLINSYDLEKEIIESVDSIIHCAASYNLKMTYQESYEANVIGTQNLCFFSKKIKTLKHFHYLSTIAVAGERSGPFKECQLDEEVPFSNGYAATKMSAEFIVRNAKLPKVRKRIYRPGIVIGDLHRGKIDRVDGPYYFLKLLRRVVRANPLTKKIPIIPFPYNSRASMPIIPVDQLVSWLSQMIIRPTDHESIRTYHLLDPKNIKMKKFLDLAFSYYGMKGRVKAIKKRFFFGTLARVASLPSSMINYMYNDIRYDTSQREEDFPELKSADFLDYSDAFFLGAEEHFKGMDL